VTNGFFCVKQWRGEVKPPVFIHTSLSPFSEIREKNTGAVQAHFATLRRLLPKALGFTKEFASKVSASSPTAVKSEGSGSGSSSGSDSLQAADATPKK